MKDLPTLTPFELEMLDFILWLLRGYREEAITKRVAIRMLRASLRRIKPPLIGFSIESEESDDNELDHAVPVTLGFQIGVSPQIES